MKLSSRELYLGVMTLMVLLLGGSVMLIRPKFDRWGQLGRERVSVERDVEREQRLLDQKERWESEFNQLRGLLSSHTHDQKMDVYWLSRMDEIATRHQVRILRRQVGEEQKMGDVYELPIECKEWEGSLDSIVRFLFDLQSEGAMLDVRQLLVKPKGKGVLRGRFSLSCAYTRKSPDTD